VGAINVAVYRFTVWDHARGENVVSPRLATLNTIEELDGVPDKGSMQLVDETELDSDGFYSGTPDNASPK
jgi:hypothetical protein